MDHLPETDNPLGIARPVSSGTPPVATRRSTPPARPNQILAIVCIGIVLANLDLFIVNVAFPNIARDFPSSTLEDLSWILNGYAIAYAALLVFFGRLAERHRRDRSFLLGITLFTAASAACAAASSVPMLVFFRVLQAAGAALMTPTSIGLLLASFPPERRGSAVRTWAAIGGLAAALGPPVGGVLILASWRWIFLVNVPIGLIAIVIGWWKLPAVPGHDVPRPSPWAALMVTGGIAALTFAIVKVNDWGWTSPGILLSFAALDRLPRVVRPPLPQLNQPLCRASPVPRPPVHRRRPRHGALFHRLRSHAVFHRGLGTECLGLVRPENGPGHRPRPAPRPNDLTPSSRPPDRPLRSRPGHHRWNPVLRRRLGVMGRP